MTIDADARRVALLARPGLARDRLSAALSDAGAHCVLAADPTQLDPAELRGLDPQVVLVALDPVTEDVLEQFDAVLGDPLVEVIYEEAEQAATREGWDAARWQRHLVAKLQGHANVLPPSVQSQALGVSPAAGVSAGATPELATASQFDPLNAEFDGFERSGGIEAAPERYAFEPLNLEPAGGDETSREAQDGSAAVLLDDDAINFDFSVPMATAKDGGSGGSTADALDDFAYDAFDPSISEAADASVGLANGGDLDAAAIATARVLALEDDEQDARVLETPESRDSFRHDLDELHERIATLELVDDTPRCGPEHAHGAVLVIAGVGGPDAVRQLLGALPDDFARPVLVQQRLDGGRYDRLVSQLQRASPLPVKLAEPDQLALAGIVYILPESIGIAASDYGMRFCSDPAASVMAMLPSADSAVLLLSGTDPVHLDAVMTHSWAGALVAGQAAEGCYDAAASNALAARGGDVATPAALALRLSARWSTQGSSNVQA